MTSLKYMANVTSSWADDTRSSEEIIALALAEEEETMWDLIEILRYRGGETEFQLAAQLTESAKTDERCLGARILGQLGCSDPTYVPESVDILIPMLGDQDSLVLYSVVYALGHRKDRRSIIPLSKLVDHPEADIRRGVAFSLGGFDDEDAINTLILLTNDSDDDVRDWATFGLGSLTEIDTPELRDALFARTNDENNEIRGEALVGLAARNDQRIIDLVRDELNRDFAGSWVLEAAELVGEPSLLPLLLALRDNWCDEDEKAFGGDLDRALKACAARNET
jgi:HEAT repeat protein